MKQRLKFTLLTIPLLLLTIQSAQGQTQPPTNLKATAIGNTVTLTWNASTSNGVTEYEIRRATDVSGDNPDWTTLRSSGDDPEITFSGTKATNNAGLIHAERYYYSIRALKPTGDGNSAWSPHYQIVTGPVGPAALAAEAVGGTKINLNWTAPDLGDNGITVAHYKLQYVKSTTAPTENTVWETIPDDISKDISEDDPEYIHKELDPGATYHYRVRAIIIADDIKGDWSRGDDPDDPVSATTGPPAPINLEATVTINGGSGEPITKVDVVWKWEKGPNTPDGATYEFQLAPGRTGDWFPDSADNINALEYEDPDNPDDTFDDSSVPEDFNITAADVEREYRFRVRAVSTIDGREVPGDWSSENGYLFKIEKETPPPPPTGGRNIYVDGIGNPTQTDINKCTHNDPCHPRVIGGRALLSGDHVFVRVRVAGDEVGTQEGISGTITIPEGHVTFSTFRRTEERSVPGTLILDTVNIPKNGTFVRDNNLAVRINVVNATHANIPIPLGLPDDNSDPDDAPQPDLNFGSDGFTVGSLRVADGTRYDHLTVKRGRLQVAGRSPSGADLTVKNLVVEQGATLVAGRAVSRTTQHPLILHVPFPSEKEDNIKFQVNGLITISGGGSRSSILIRSGEGDKVYTSETYRDKGDKDGKNCVRITGGSRGEIAVPITADAAGNVCIDLNRIFSLTVNGSATHTTDVIFTKDVRISRELTQRDDTRVHFEKKATITGDVKLDGNSSSSRGTTCSGKPHEFPGIQFADEATIGKRLILEHGNSVQGSGCQTKVSFMKPALDGTEDVILNSRVLDDIVVDKDGRIELGGTVYERSVREDGNDEKYYYIDRDLSDEEKEKPENDLKAADGSKKVEFDPDNSELSLAHNLSVGDDIYADASNINIDMNGAARALTDAECRGDNDVQLGEGTRLTLAGESQTIALGQGENTVLEIKTLVANGRVRVDGSGILKSTTLQVGEKGELVSSEQGSRIQVGQKSSDDNDPGTPGYLLLQGEGLDGELGEDSNVQYLTYAASSNRTDFVQLDGAIKALTFSAPAGSRALLRTPTEVEKLGLCSGELILVDTQDKDTRTLIVTEQITVRDGKLEKDENEPGDFATDYNKEGGKLVPAATDSYLLRYVNDGEHTAEMEWDKPRDVVLGLGTGSDEPAPVITVEESKETKLHGKVHIFKGTLQVNSDLTVGASTIIPDAGRLLTIHNGELHSNGNDVVVHGEVTAGANEREVAKILTGDGNLHVLGNDENADKDNPSTDDGDEETHHDDETKFDDPKKGGHYQANTAKVTVSAKSTIDVGDGTLQLGPAYTVKKDDLHANEQDDTRPEVSLSVERHRSNVGTVKGIIDVPKGSKRTTITGEAFDTIVMDGTRNDRKSSGTNTNWEGHLDLVAYSGQDLVIDSVSASDGSADFHADATKKVTINKNVVVSSASLYQETQTLEFKKDLAISGTGGFSSRGGAADARKSVTVGGDFSQETSQKTGGVHRDHPEGATYLSGFTNLTVTGDFTVSGEGTAQRFGSFADTKLNLKGDFDFGLTAEDYILNANLTFSGKETQSVKTAAIDLNHVTIDGTGISLESDVTQWAGNSVENGHSNGADLTLIKGVIGSSDGKYAWVVENTDIEQNLVGRTSARAGDKTCGPEEARVECTSTIIRGSRQSYASTVFARHLLEGNAGDGDIGGGYIFPVGGIDGDNSYYRPAIVQLPVDLADAQKVSASMTEIPEGATPAWPDENLRAQGAGGDFLTLDTYAKIFWKLDAGDEELATNVNLRLAAAGVPNVFDHTKLRIVQWDCDWTNPRVAGQYDLSGGEEGSFVANDYVNGTLNLTQEGIDIGSCSIFAVAANQLENPINQPDLASGRARLQFVHNAQIPAPVNVKLDGDLEVVSGATFQSATGYLHVAAGGHSVSVEIVGAPEASQPADISLGSLVNNRSYAVVAHGGGTNIAFKRLETRMKSLSDRSVDVLLVHGSADLGSVRLQTINILDDPRTATPTRLLANNFSFDQATNYIQMDPDYYRIEAISGDDKVAVFDLNLSGYQGQTLIANLSGSRATNNLDLYVVDQNGSRVNADVVTGTESEITEIPTEFALHGNYPNPFNPSTRIQFDLPESAQVTVQIVDMLGREVMALPAKEFAAGANRSIELNAINLASGTYLYRMIATGAESRYVKTGRMTLVK